MKAISLILGLLLASNTAFAGLPPTTAKGQQDTSPITTFNFQTPNKLATKVAGATLIESGNKNILQNPSFEATPNPNHPGWVQTGIVSPNVETSVVIDGKQSVKLTSPNQTLDFHADSTLYAAQFADGVQGLAMIRAKTTTTDTPIYMCPRTAGAYPTVKTTGCVQLQTNGKWGLYKVPFVLGGTSNGIGITSNGVATTGDVYIDDAFVGPVDLKTDTLIQTQDYVATLTSANVPSSVTKNTGSGLFSVSNVGNRIRFTALKNITIDGSGSYEVSGAGGAGAVSIWYLNGNSRNVDRVVSNNNASNSASAAINTTLLATEYVEFEGAVYAVGAYSSANVSLTATSNTSTSTYSSSCGANCVDTFSAMVSATGVVSQENVDWLSGDCTNVTSPVCTFNTSIFTASPNCWSSPTGTGAGGGGAVSGTSTFTSYLYNTSFTPISGQRQIFCQKQGADFVATRTLQGFFNEVMATPGQSKVKEITMTYGNSTGSSSAPVVCSASPCSIYTNSSGSFSSLTWASTGVMQVTVANGTFAANSEYECQCKGYVSGSGVNCVSYANGNQTILTNSSGGLIMGINSTSMAGTAANSFGVIKCRGIAP